MSSCKSTSRVSACVAVCLKAFEAHEGWFAVIDVCFVSVMDADFGVEAALLGPDVGAVGAALVSVCTRASVACACVGVCV